MKGDYKDTCNITRCDKDNAIYYNHSTRMYYCEHCANRLNMDKFNSKEALQLFGHDLLTLGLEGKG